MPWLTEKRKQALLNAVIAVVFAIGLWYMVIGSEQVETQVEVRLEYRGLGENLVIRDGMVGRIAVRLRGSQELLRTINNRDLTYTVDLSGLNKGAHVLPLDLSSHGDLRAFEIVEIIPSRLVLDVDAVGHKTVPLLAEITPIPETEPFRLSYAILDPDTVTLSGPESELQDLDRLTVHFNPNQDLSEGSKAISLAIGGPEQIAIAPPVTTLYYTVVARTNEMSFERLVQLDGLNMNEYLLEPARVSLTIDVPDSRREDPEYLAGVRVVALPTGELQPGQSETAPVFVLLPEGARLLEVSPSHVTVHRNLEEPGPTTSPNSSAVLDEIINNPLAR